MDSVDSVPGTTGGRVVTAFDTGLGCAWPSGAAAGALVCPVTCVGWALVGWGGCGGVGEIFSSSARCVNKSITQMVTTMMAVRSMKQD